MLTAHQLYLVAKVINRDDVIVDDYSGAHDAYTVTHKDITVTLSTIEELHAYCVAIDLYNRD